MQKQLRVNNQIRVPQVQVLGENGAQLGIMKTVEAITKARIEGLDLVEVNPNSEPPLAKIMDYGKYMYRKEKQDKQSKKTEKEQQLKIIKIGLKTGEHDLRYRASQVDKFLHAGHLVKLEIFLKGRERALSGMARGKLEDFLKYIKDHYSIQNDIKRIPSGWTMLIQKAKK